MERPGKGAWLSSRLPHGIWQAGRIWSACRYEAPLTSTPTAPAKSILKIATVAACRTPAQHSKHFSITSRELAQDYQMPVQLAATLAEIEEGFAHEGAVQCQQTGLVGEETLTRFDSKMWFAVRVGDLLCDRYKVLGKVANGGSSTIWFVQDTL